VVAASAAHRTTGLERRLRMLVAIGAASWSVGQLSWDVQVATGSSEVFGELRLVFDGCLHYRRDQTSPVDEGRVVTERILSLVPAGSGFFTTNTRGRPRVRTLRPWNEVPGPCSCEMPRDQCDRLRYWEGIPLALR